MSLAPGQPRSGSRRIGEWAFLGSGVGVWAAIFVVPLAVLYLAPAGPALGLSPAAPGPRWTQTAVRSVGLSAGIAALAVVLGFLPGRLLARSLPGGGPSPARAESPAADKGRIAVLFLFLLPLLLPSYVLYYAWETLLSPTTALGRFTSSRTDLARLAAHVTTTLVLTCWHWPVAALVLAQGWRNLDASTMELARLDAGPARRLAGVVLPLLGRPLALAFGACFVLSLCEYTTFHLAGINTLGTELDGMFRLGGDERAVARSAWPLVVPAAAIALGLWRLLPRPPRFGSPAAETFLPPAPRPRARRAEWVALAVLLAVSCAAPIGMLLLSLSDPSKFLQFWDLHRDELRSSAWVSLAAGLVCLWIAHAALALGRPARWGGARSRRREMLRSLLSGAMQATILICMFLPPSLLAVSILKTLACLGLPPAVRDGWMPVSAGLVLRYAGLALLVLWFARQSESRELDDLAAVDGASPARAWWHVHLPRRWPLSVGALLMVLMFGMTEVPATVLLLPAGLPSLPLSLLNQMHYVRDQQVVVACLVLIGAYLLLAGAVVACAAVWTMRREITDYTDSRIARIERRHSN